MKLLRLAVLATPLVLAACSGSAPPATESSSASAAAPQAAAEKPAAPAAAPAEASLLDPLYGKWAVDLKQCEGPGPGAITISETRFEGAENGCDINGFTDNKNGTFTAALTCSSQGQTANENIQMRPIFAPTGEGIDMVYLNRKNATFTVLRCKQPAARNQN
ncbi:MAG: hypothetical protein ABL879_10075 [Devosia sp.]